ERLEATLQTARDGARTAFESAAVLGWTRRHRRFTELNAFNQFLATGETAAHLDLLVAREVLGASTVNGVLEYRLRHA
ncbi:MAG: MBL fold metallo-hydrolase, partial [Haloechinothrix sp.]